MCSSPFSLALFRVAVEFGRRGAEGRGYQERSLTAPLRKAGEKVVFLFFSFLFLSSPCSQGTGQ